MAKVKAVSSISWQDNKGKELLIFRQNEDKVIIVPQRCTFDELQALRDACDACMRLLVEQGHGAKAETPPKS